MQRPKQRRPGDGRLLPKVGRLEGCSRIDVSRRTARVNDAAKARAFRGAKKVLRPADIHLPVAARIVNGVELPGEVQSRVDGARLEKLVELFPGRRQIKFQQCRKAAERPAAR